MNSLIHLFVFLFNKQKGWSLLYKETRDYYTVSKYSFIEKINKIMLIYEAYRIDSFYL